MRARGAKVTDIVVLVVAADDGVMPQTVEAIHHAKAAKVPIIVAINKIDKPDAKPERVRTELLQHEIQVESLGGEVVDVEVSATKKTEHRQAAGDDRRCRPKSSTSRPIRSVPAEGTVIEAKLDRGRGPVATVLVQRGTLQGRRPRRRRRRMGPRARPGLRHAASRSRPPARRSRSRCSASPARRDAGDRLAVVENEARAREVTDYPRPPEAREDGGARHRHARLARADDGAGQDIQAARNSRW